MYARHSGEGAARLMRTALGTQCLRFEGFSVTNGPKLEVWLVEAPVAASADAKAARVLSLGPLHGERGDQTYPLPPGTDTARQPHAAHWRSPVNN